MNKKPHLIFPHPKSVKPEPGRRPKFTEQRKKTEQIDQFDETIMTLDQLIFGDAKLQNTTNELNPESVLVLEIKGSISDFYKTLSKDPNFQFLVEYDREDYIEEKDDENYGEIIRKKVFLTLTNLKGVKQLQSYWKSYKYNNSFKRGSSKFKNLFEQLENIRPYNVLDRIDGCDFKEFILNRKENSFEKVKIEIEFFFSDDSTKRESKKNKLIELLNESKGKIIPNSEVVIQEIHYHGLIIEAPLYIFDDLEKEKDISLLKANEIRYFRPSGQAIIKENHDMLDTIESKDRFKTSELLDEPIVALLDGYPLANHSLLKEHLIIDDPNEYASGYNIGEHIHGTSMASLIIHGDLNSENENPLKRKIYIRHILKPDINIKSGNVRRECIPDDKLMVDVIHQSVIESLKKYPSIKIINLSVGDEFRPFLFEMSPTAKLIDWLSEKYNILFIISAGNYETRFDLEIKEDEFLKLSIEEKEQLFLKEMARDRIQRKIISPAESLNAVTVGAYYSDESEIIPPNNIFILSEKNSPAPYSRIGSGYNGSIKPDILAKGGRSAYSYLALNGKIQIRQRQPSLYSPAQLTAYPGSKGSINSKTHFYGTSNAAALTTRLAAELYEILLELNSSIELENKIDTGFFPVLIKALIAHSSTWSESGQNLKQILGNRKLVSRFVGYGNSNPEFVQYSTDYKAIALGYGSLKQDKAHEFSFPLPPSLSSKAIEKKINITLAYLAPLNFKSQRYRQARLTFENIKSNAQKKIITLKRDETDFKMMRRGTIQHDVLKGTNADVFQDDDSLKIHIQCKEEAGRGRQFYRESKEITIRYALIVSMEVDDKNQIPIYDEIQQRIQSRIQPKVKI